MITVLLWIVGCYVLAAAVIFVLSVVRRGRERRAKHYVLLAGNEDQRMEWYMHSLHRFSHLTGTDVKVTVVDNGSEDDTLHIARAFAKRGMDVRVHARVDGMDEGRTGDAGQKESREVADVPRDGRSDKWKRFRVVWRWRVGDSAEAAGAATSAAGELGRRRSAAVEPTHLLWLLQAEGIVSASEHAVLIDLRDPADLSKLPF